MTMTTEPKLSPVVDEQLNALFEAAVTEVPVEEVEAAGAAESETPVRQLVIVNWSGEFDRVLPTLIMSSAPVRAVPISPDEPVIRIFMATLLPRGAGR